MGRSGKRHRSHEHRQDQQVRAQGIDRNDATERRQPARLQDCHAQTQAGRTRDIHRGDGDDFHGTAAQEPGRDAAYERSQDQGADDPVVHPRRFLNWSVDSDPKTVSIRRA